MHSLWLLCLPLAQAAIKGFVYHNNFSTDEYLSQFAKGKSAVGWSDAFLTIIDKPSAIEAAVQSGTKLFINFESITNTSALDNQIELVTNASRTYGSRFNDILSSITVGGSELAQGLSDPANIAASVARVKTALRGTSLEKTPVGHFEPTESWVNDTMQPVIDGSDFVGVVLIQYGDDILKTIEPGISFATGAITRLQSKISKRMVVITAWSTSKAVGAGRESTVVAAKRYWDSVGCDLLFDRIDTFWNGLTVDDVQDVNLLDSSGSPLFNLTCANAVTSSTPLPDTSSSAEAPSFGLSDGAKIGIGVGAGVGGAIILGLLAFWAVKRRRKIIFEKSWNEGTAVDENPGVAVD